MAGVVIETVSNVKLIVFTVVLLLLQIATYLIGGLIAPAPFHPQDIIATKCLDVNFEHEKWFWSRGEGKCTSVDHLDEAFDRDPNQIVFTFQYPIPRKNEDLQMSRWFQNMIGVLVPDIRFASKGPNLGKKPVLTLDARLGARDKTDPISNWTQLAWSHEVRPLECHPPVDIEDTQSDEADGYRYNCDPLPLFELGSCHYDYYLLNIRLPAFDKDKVNTEIGKPEEFTLISIHQNGGFSKVWFSLKAVFFPIILITLIWYWVRVIRQSREPNLLEKSLFALGVAMSFLNLPVEFFTLWIYMPYMLLFSDIRQGLFYSVLLCFWVLFAGEHLMDKGERNRMVVYWKQLSGVLFGCICLFIFEMCERGVQLTNPFYSIWSVETSANLAYAFIILAGIAACFYFLFLLYMVVQVFKNISIKKGALDSMSKARKKFYIGIIYRFKFMMSTTLLCAALTVIFFIIGQVSEGEWKWDEGKRLEHTSAFLTGVYGMWNLYVFALLILYAPSTKMFQTSVNEDDSEGETVEFTTIPSETSAVAAFARKTAAD